MRMNVKPDVITPRINTPITVPVMRPTPPASDVPPITTAAIASSSYITPIPAWPEIARGRRRPHHRHGDRCIDSGRDDVGLHVHPHRRLLPGDGQGRDHRCRGGGRH